MSDASHPHITICQFVSVEESILPLLWDKLQSLELFSLAPKFLGVNFQKGAGEHSGYYWAQLLVERDQWVMETHRAALGLLEMMNLQCLSDHGEIYKPHVTLARILLKSPLALWDESILDPSTFKLTIGLSDKHGQYLKTLFE